MSKKRYLFFIIIGVLILGLLVIYNPFLKFSLVGDKNLEIPLGTEYQDKGAKASYFNQDLTSSINVHSNLNTDEIGTYKYEYTLRKGIYKRTLVRTIKVVDDIAPVITLVGSDNITLCGKEYLELGYQAIDNVDGDITSKVVSTSSDDKIIYTIKDESGNETTIVRNIIKNDKIVPVITLKGANVVTVKKNSSYVELGAVANDNCDGNLNDKVKIENKIDLNKTGIYEVVYKVNDMNNNDAEVKRLVKVYDDNDLVVNEKTVIAGPKYINDILLVNKKYSIPSSFKADDTEARAALKKLQAAGKEEKLNLPLISGYRSYDTQVAIYNRNINNRGMAYTLVSSAKPGHSEHQTGLAFDVGQISASFGNTKAGIWLEQNCYKYGFIIRYPQYKEGITGYKYEPWHIRYVGEKAAAEIMKNNLTLEEYLGEFKAR